MQVEMRYIGRSKRRIEERIREGIDRGDSKMRVVVERRARDVIGMKVRRRRFERIEKM